MDAILHALCKESAMSVKHNQDYCLLWYHGSKVWTVSINMKVQLQLALMAEDNINTYGNELAARQKLNTHVLSH